MQHIRIVLPPRVKYHGDPKWEGLYNDIMARKNMRAFYGDVPLIHYVLQEKEAPFEFVKMIVDKDPSTVNQIDPNGRVPLDLVVGSYERTEYLYQKGAYPIPFWDYSKSSGFEMELTLCLNGRPVFETIKLVMLHLRYGAFSSFPRVEYHLRRAWELLIFPSITEYDYTIIRRMLLEIICATQTISVLVQDSVMQPRYGQKKYSKLHLLPIEMFRNLKRFIMSPHIS